jgi:hypothetical protein
MPTSAPRCPNSHLQGIGYARHWHTMTRVGRYSSSCCDVRSVCPCPRADTGVLEPSLRVVARQSFGIVAANFCHSDFFGNCRCRQALSLWHCMQQRHHMQRLDVCSAKDVDGSVVVLLGAELATASAKDSNRRAGRIDRPELLIDLSSSPASRFEPLLIALLATLPASLLALLDGLLGGGGGGILAADSGDGLPATPCLRSGR